MSAKIFNHQGNNISAIVEMEYKGELISISTLDDNKPYAEIAAWVGNQIVFGPDIATVENIIKAKEAIDKQK